MRALQLVAPGQHRVVDLPDPSPGPDDIVVDVKASGICGTDLRIVAGDYGHTSFPLVIGHEFGGTVRAVGENVTAFAPGDLVGADPNVYCGRCEWCRRRAVNLCADLTAIGVTRTGALAEQVSVPARLAVRLPASLDAETAALIEPLSCVLHAMDRGDVLADRSMLVYGAGAIGLMVLITALAKGLTVMVAEPHDRRRDRALALGAAAAVEDVAALGAGAAFDYVLDASGSTAAIADGLSRLRPRGTLIQMGVAPTAATLPFSPYHLYEKEWRIVGSNSVADCYQAAAGLMPRIAEKMRSLVTHRLDLEDFAEATYLMRTPDAIKVQLLPSRADGR